MIHSSTAFLSPFGSKDTADESAEEDPTDLVDPLIKEKADAAAKLIHDSRNAGRNPSAPRKPPPSNAALTEQEIKLGLPDCSILGKFSFKRNLRTRVAKAIKNINKRQQRKEVKYACELEGHTGLEIVATLANEEYTTPPHPRIKSFIYEAEKKAGYKAHHFIRDAIKKWRKELRAMDPKDKYGCNYGASKTHYFVVCYFDIQQED
ncbi:hypothetical protein Y032_0015g2843 [Ancylostoma ceylanicum]|uniref:Uncharacterized protein n=1 Tax=Ancylostoma ceylanicum TaxID=53326 RepID=A0A016VAP7_9BILA|nr:hypothetical protein Y032_0015g2843 [Ancylostoma ceylanicum]